MSQQGPRRGGNQPLTPRRATISGARPDHPCAYCRKLLGANRETCSARCRLLVWALKTIMRDLEEGRAPGLVNVDGDSSCLIMISEKFLPRRRGGTGRLKVS
jgi:hypothetical protein